MRVLVTGGRGFLGKHIGAELERGHTVVAADVVDGPGRDMRDAKNVRAWLEHVEPDVVLHLAAKVGRQFGEEDVCRTVADNAGMTATVAQACGDAGVRLAYASTSEVYGDCAEACVAEDAVGRLPHNLYGLSKRWGEEVCRLYAPTGLVVLRFSMPYGPGHPPGRGRAALTNFLWNAHERRPIPVHRNSERSWCWVGDTARAVRMILDLPDAEAAGAWNVGRDDNSLPMVEVARMACDLVGAPHSLIEEVDAPARQTVVKRLDTRKLAALGWKPEVDLAEGMRRTYDWLLA